jgi:hypothetical protein
MALQTLKKTAVGAPTRRGGISLFPLFLEAQRDSRAVIADNSLEVSELATASVPQLQVTNKKDIPVIIPAGRVLEGGRQTRTVNVSILVPAGATIVIPVSCVEAGRWHGGSRFQDSKRIAGRSVRMAKERGVKRNIDEFGAKFSDQGAVWNSISAELSERHIFNESSNYLAADSFVDDNQELYEALQELLKVGHADGQTGIAVAYGNKIAGFELFTNPDDFAASWETLVRSAVLDSPAATNEEVSVNISDVETFLADVAQQEATVAAGTGLGTEYHVASEKVVAHALTDDDGQLIHAYAFAEI